MILVLTEVDRSAGGESDVILEDEGDDVIMGWGSGGRGLLSVLSLVKGGGGSVAAAPPASAASKLCCWCCRSSPGKADPKKAAAAAGGNLGNPVPPGGEGNSSPSFKPPKVGFKMLSMENGRGLLFGPRCEVGSAAAAAAALAAKAAAVGKKGWNNW